jgi:hypothetical protein
MPPEVNVDSFTGPLGQDIDDAANDLNTSTPEHVPIPPSLQSSSPASAFPTTYSSGCPMCHAPKCPTGIHMCCTMKVTASEIEDGTNVV